MRSFGNKSCKSFYFSQEAKRLKIHRKLMTSILKTFHHFNRSSADNKHRTRSYDLWRVTGNWSHALVTSACCHEIFVAVVSNFNTVFTFFDKNSPHRSRNSHAYLFFFYLPTRLWNSFFAFEVLNRRGTSDSKCREWPVEAKIKTKKERIFWILK